MTGRKGRSGRPAQVEPMRERLRTVARERQRAGDTPEAVMLAMQEAARPWLATDACARELQMILTAYSRWSGARIPRGTPLFGELPALGTRPVKEREWSEL